MPINKNTVRLISKVNSNVEFKSSLAKYIHREYWFINAGLLTETNYRRGFENIPPNIDPEELNALLFLCIDHLIQYFEIASINSTKLINQCIKRHLIFVEKLIDIYDQTYQRYIAPEYWNIIYHVFHQFSTTEDNVEKQFCVDAIERMCGFLTIRYKYWVRSAQSVSLIKSYRGLRKHCVIYNSFLIPNIKNYLDPLISPEQKLFEKIEHECKCKILLSKSDPDCRSKHDEYLLEVLFDGYRGNFVGFLDCLTYIVKVLNPTKFFIKSMRTVIRTKDYFFSILSDLPLKELMLIEKHATTGNLIAPFLPNDVLTKQAYRHYIPDLKKMVNETIVEYFTANEDVEFWNSRLSHSDLAKYKENVTNFISDYQCWRLLCNEWNDFETYAQRRPKRKQYSLGSIKECRVDEHGNVIKLEDQDDDDNNTEEGEINSKELETKEVTFAEPEESEDTEESKETDDEKKNNRDSKNSKDSSSEKKDSKKDNRDSKSSKDSNSEKKVSKKDNRDSKNSKDSKESVGKKEEKKISKESSKESNENSKYNINQKLAINRHLNESNTCNATKKIRKPKRFNSLIKNRYGNLNNDTSRDSRDSYKDIKAINRKERISSRDSEEIDSKEITYPSINQEVKTSVYKRFSIRNPGADSLTEEIANEKIYDIFEGLYERREKFREQPHKMLNHTLRVILRCKTDYTESDKILSKLDQPYFTIHDLLKELYNFDLQEGNFYTREQRRESYIKKMAEKSRKEREERERAEYLLSRNQVSAEIEIGIDSDSDSVEEIEEEEEEEEEEESEDITEDSEEIRKLDIGGGPTDTSLEDFYVLNDDILFGDFRETKELFSPKFQKEINAVFGDIPLELLQLFNENRIGSTKLWEKILKNKEAISKLIPLPHRRLTCEATESYMKYINPDQIELVASSVSNNIYITLKLLSNNEVALDDEFPKLLKGEGMTLNFLGEINKHPINAPKYFSSMGENRINLKTDFFRNMCMLSFDLYIICGSLYQGLSISFDIHKNDFLRLLKLQNRHIQDLCAVFELPSRIEESQALFKFRLMSRSKEEISILLRLSLDIRRFCQLIYHDTCCTWNKMKCIHILYASVHIDGNKKSWEPFMRKSGDRRIKRIEMKCNCFITMKMITHERTGAPIPFIEVFYDFFRGNHFACFDMIRKLFADNRNGTVRFVNFKHLVCMPQGELWIMPDLEWIRSRLLHLVAQETVTASSAVRESKGKYAQALKSTLNQKAKK